MSRKERTRPGPPDLLTPDAQARIVEAARLGAPQRTCAQRGGITVKTLEAWLDRGRSEPEGKYHDFAVAFDDADSDVTVRMLQSIDRAADSDWKAAAWLLERKHKDAFAARVSVTTAASVRTILDGVKGHMSGSAYQEFVHAAGVVGGVLPGAEWSGSADED